MPRPRLSVIRYVATCFAIALLLTESKPLSAQSKRHQYSWSEWTTLNDGKSNGVQFSFRKGDNDFIERGMVFVRFYNRYRQQVNGEVSFDIVNEATGQSKSAQEPFDLKAESLGEDEGSWDSAPGNNDSPDRWSSAPIALRNIRVKQFTVESGADGLTERASRVGEAMPAGTHAVGSAQGQARQN